MHVIFSWCRVYITFLTQKTSWKLRKFFKNFYFLTKDDDLSLASLVLICCFLHFGLIILSTIIYLFVGKE